MNVLAEAMDTGRAWNARTKTGRTLGLLVLAIAASCVSSKDAGRQDNETAGFMFHHECFNAVSYALYFGTADEMRARMTIGFLAQRAPNDLLAEFESRVGRGRMLKGRVTNLDRLLQPDIYNQRQRVLFIPWDADKAAYILFLTHTTDGCRVDEVEFR